MASIALSTALKTARLQAIITILDAGSGPGALRLYTAPQPAAGEAITTQTLLITLPLADPAGSVAGNLLTFATVADALCVADGVIGWGRLVDSAETWCADLDATVSGGGGAITVDNLTVYTGGTIRTISATLTEP